MSETPRWKLNRAGLINFWYYDNEIFDFADGKLLLTGANGSGKSVTMQSLITVLLDGNTRPSRLDPFGTKSRRINDYLLGEADVSHVEERTGYLFLEYTMPGSGNYVTTGIGLQARRNVSKLGFWGFVLHGQRRVGEGFELVKWRHDPETGKRQPMPLSRRELENEIKPHEGQVVRNDRTAYKILVNNHLFNFATIEGYDDLIKLLIHLRSPKLSKDFKPTVIHNILHDSLAPLSEDELRPLSDTLDNINQARGQLKQLKDIRATLLNLRKPYNRYNNYLMVEKAQHLLTTRDKAVQKQDELHAAQRCAEQERTELAAKVDKQAELERELRVVEKEIQGYRKHDVFVAEREKLRLEDEQQKHRGTQKSKQKIQTQKRDKLTHLNTELNTNEREVERLRASVLDQLDCLQQPAHQAAFGGHEQEARYLRRDPFAEQHFDHWKTQAEKHRDALRQLETLLKEVERQEERHNEARIEMERVQEELQDLRDKQTKQEQQFEAAKETCAEQLEQWLQDHSFLTLSADEIGQTKRAILNLYDAKWQSVMAAPETAMNRRRDLLTQEALSLNHELNQLKQCITDAEKELQTWQQQRDPEPPRHPDTNKARELLVERKIPFLPFYQAVEFKSDLDQKKRERIEAALLQMGILDALVVPPWQDCPLHDRVIRAMPPALGGSLADVFGPTPAAGITSEDIQKVLQGIPFDNLDHSIGESRVLPSGNFCIGPLEGHAPREEAAVFIGKEARRRYRENRIAALESQIAELQRKFATIQQELKKLEELKHQVVQARQNFPKEAPVETAFEALEKIRRDVAGVKRESDKINQRFKDTLDTLRKLKAQVKEEGQALKLPLDLSTFAVALKAMDQYLSSLGTLGIKHANLKGLQEKVVASQLRLKEIQMDMELLETELLEVLDVLAEIKMELGLIENRLRSLGAEEVRQRLAALNRRNSELPQLIECVKDRRRELEFKLKQFERDQTRMQGEKDELLSLYRLWHQTFRYELVLRLAQPFNYDPLPTSVWRHPQNTPNPQDRDPLLRAARNFHTEFGDLLKSDRSRFQNDLVNAFHKNRGDILENDPQLINYIPEDLSPDQIEVGPNYPDAWMRLKQIIPRQNLKLLYDNRRYDLHDAIKTVEIHIREQENVLSERDQNLYREVILNNISNILTTRIHRTKTWEGLMNKLMSERNTSSGLVFSLEWKPKVAESEDQLDTEALVTLLTKDRRMLNDQQLKQLIAHFKSRLEAARLISEEQGAATSFHEEVKRVLDYRDWFQFQLYYRKPNKPRRQLTDTVFGKFSGGEKAMAMYIPLFSATWSRYDAARADAPRLISLDEAFAGVDENNIRDMFGLLDQMDFDYLINSQSLWGDYDTVSSLAVVLLLRLKDSDLVTPVRFLWNGKKLISQSVSQDSLFDGEF